MADPWAEFRVKESAPAADPWAEFRTSGPGLGETAYDVAASGAAGVGKGVAQMTGALGDMRDLAGSAVTYLANKAGIDPSKMAALKAGINVLGSVAPGPASAIRLAPTAADVQKGIEKVTGEFHKPTTELGKGAEAIGEFVPAAATTALTGGGGTLAGNLTRFAAIPGTVSTLAEKYLPESDYKPYVKAGLTVGSTLVNPARVVTPLEASPAKRAAVDVLEREGVTSLTAGQRTGNKSLQYLESAASHAPGAGGGAARIEHEGQRQFTEAATRRARAAGDASPEVLSANQRRLRQAYDDISARNNIVPDNRMITDIVDSVQRYRFVPGSQQHAMVQGYIDDIIPHINNGTMSGQQYQALRSFLTADAKSASDGYLGNALKGIRGALDRAMERSVSPEDAVAWRNLNREYSAQKVLEKAASRAGEATAEGQITPANLRNTVAAEDRSGYARGRGQFNELARAGVQVMTPLPNSGTAQRSHAYNLMAAILGGGLGAVFGNAPGAAIGAGIGHMAAAAGPAVVGRSVMSKPVQAYLANQLLGGALPNSPAARAVLVAELMKQQVPQIGGPNDK